MKLIVVYKAHSGITQGILDTVHTTVSPDTYECRLYQLTHGPFSRTKSRWKRFLRSVPFEVASLYRDEFFNQYPGINTAFPVILKKEATQFSIVVSAEEINTMQSLDQLIDLASQRIKTQ